MAKNKLLVRGLVALILAALMLCSLQGCSNGIRHYIAFGDSITKGRGEGYPPKIAELLSESSNDTYIVANEGRNGRTSFGGAEDIQTAIDNNPDATHVLILLGTNDSTGDIDHPTFRQNMQKIIDAVKQAEKIPLLAKVPIKYSECFNEGCDPFNDPPSAEVNSRIRLYNRVIDQLVQMNQLKVTQDCALSPPDYYRYFEIAAIGENDLPLEFNDPWHPNEQGYQAMAELWLHALREGVCLKWPRFPAGAGVLDSPALGADDTIYLGVGEHLHAITSNRTVVWSIEIGTPGLTGSPAIGADGTIYIGSANGDVHAISPDGEEKPNWPFRSSGSDEITYTPTTSPAIAADGTIYIGTLKGNVHAIGPDGEEKPNWPFHTGAGIVSSPAIGMDDTIYIGSNDGKIYSLNRDGSLNWSYETGDPVRSSPAIGADGTIYIGSDDGMVYAINPNGTIKENWPFTIGRSVRSSPAIGADGTIYIGADDGKLHAITPEGAEKQNWPFQTGAEVRSSPAIAADGTIFVGSNDGNIYAINPNGMTKWSFQTDLEEVEAPPVIGTDGTIYVGDVAGFLYAIESDSGGCANSPWPMFRHDLENTGRGGGQ
jgi:outer membrane protein assembly factor BamB/lysophospholipase L1-like esterase